MSINAPISPRNETVSGSKPFAGVECSPLKENQSTTSNLGLTLNFSIA